MAKDDYFVLAYRILKYLYECFKAGERADTDMFGPAALGINNGCWTWSTRCSRCWRSSAS